jgi:anti-sigma factor RsiW
MDYERRRALVSAWIDGETTAEEADQVQAWLESDEGLAHFIDTMEAIDDELTVLALTPPAIDLTATVMAAVNADVAVRRERRVARLWWAAGALTAVAVVVALVFQADVLRFADAALISATPADAAPVTGEVAAITLDWAPLVVVLCLTVSAALVLPAAVAGYQQRLRDASGTGNA